MLPFATFSIHDLVGFIVTIPLAGIFYVIYWKFGRRLLDLLFANWLAAVGVYCLIAFLEDNLIREGQSSYAVPGAAETTLLLFRIVYAVAIFALITELHFVLRYCRVKNVLSRNIMWLYVAGLLAIPAVWTPWWLKLRTVPHGDVASWLVAVPWMPDPGPLQAAFSVAWVGVMGYSVVLLFRHSERTTEAGTLSQHKLVRQAIVFQLATATVDVVFGVLALATISVLPISTMIVALLISVALVRERVHEERAKEQVAHEMELAADLQRSLLPEDHPPVCGYEMVGWSLPAQQAGGDTYDFLCLPEGRWMITIADASGHGLSAAMVIAETRAILRSVAQRVLDADVILSETHRQLVSDANESTFVTAFIGILDPLNGTLDYASAGHGPLIFYNRNASTFEVEDATAPPLAMLDGIDFAGKARQRQLKPGDMLVLTTDGLYEAQNNNGEQYGIRRLIEGIFRDRHKKAKDIIGHARHSVDAFRQGNMQVDDMTMVILQRRNPAQ